MQVAAGNVAPVPALEPTTEVRPDGASCSQITEAEAAGAVPSEIHLAGDRSDAGVPSDEAGRERDGSDVAIADSPAASGGTIGRPSPESHSDAEPLADLYSEQDVCDKHDNCPAIDLRRDEPKAARDAVRRTAIDGPIDTSRRAANITKARADGPALSGTAGRQITNAEVACRKSEAVRKREIEALQRWLHGVAELGLRVPCRNDGVPACTTIANEAGLKLSLLKPKGALRPDVAKAVDQLGAMPLNDYLGQRHGAEARKDRSVQSYGDKAADALASYLAKLEKEKGYIEESTHDVGHPSYDKTLKAAQVRYPTRERLYARDRLFRMIDEVAGRLGLGPSRRRLVRADNGGNMTYQMAASLAVQQGGKANSTANRRKSCLNKIRDFACKSPADLIGIEFGSDFEDVVAKLSAGYENSDTRRHFEADARFWRVLLKPYVIAADLPQAFSEALATLMRERNVPNATQLAKIAEVSSVTMQHWLSGKTEPMEIGAPAVAKLEAHFGLAGGTLASRISLRLGRTHIRREAWPPCLEKEHVQRRVRDMLPPDFTSLPMAERESIGQKLLRSTASRIAFRLAKAETRPWRLKEFPTVARSQWETFTRYKRGKYPGKFRRNERWESEDSGIRAYEQYLTFFSSVCLSRSDFGLGLGEDSLTFAMFVSTEMVVWHAEWLQARSGEVLHTGIRSFLADVRSILRPTTGYLWQRPELACSLTPVEGYISSEEVESWKSSPAAWRDACAEAHRNISEVMKTHEGEYVFRRNPFEPIKPILDSSSPIDFLDDLVARAWADMPPQTEGHKLKRAAALRNILLYKTLIETTLRLKNLSHLDYREDGRGRLRKEGERYVVEIPAREFKNKRSRFFSQGSQGRIRQTPGVPAPPYRKVLPECMTPLFDEYLRPETGGRATLRAQQRKPDGEKSAGPDALWVSSVGRAGTKMMVARICFNLTRRYLAYNSLTGTGVPGVEWFCAHAVRHIVATHLVKKYGSVSLAAAQLQDTEEVVAARYAQFLPHEKTALATAMLEKGRVSPPWM